MCTQLAETVDRREYMAVGPTRFLVFRMAWPYSQPRPPSMLQGAEYYLRQPQPTYGYYQPPTQYYQQPQWPFSERLLAEPCQQGPVPPYYQQQYYQPSPSTQYYQQATQPFQYAQPPRRYPPVIKPPAPRLCRRCRGASPWDALFCCWCGLPLGY